MAANYSSVVFFQIINQNAKIIHTDYMRVHSKYNKHVFYVTMTTEMVPTCNIIIFFYHESSKEIIADGLVYHVSMELKNKVRSNTAS